MVEEDEEWQLLFDGAAPTRGRGIGIVLIEPQLQEATGTYKLTYECSNNEAKYKALIMGLELARSKGIQRLTIKGDSCLVIQQLKRDFAVKELALLKYRTRAQQILQGFKIFKFEHVTRSQNKYADALANLA